MIARMHPARATTIGVSPPPSCSRWAPRSPAAGCWESHHQPQHGVVDPHQPKELEMVSMPPYVIEPPDELEISVRPASVEMPLTTVTVQADGVVDLGFIGDVYLAGLTLAQAEQKIAEHLEPIARQKKISEPVEVSVRLVNGSQSKYLLRAWGRSRPRVDSRSSATRRCSTRSSPPGSRSKSQPEEGLPRPPPSAQRPRPDPQDRLGRDQESR